MEINEKPKVEAAQIENMDQVGVQSTSTTLDPSTTIPNEIWVKILSQLKQSELVRARLVCSSWRNVLDEHFNFSVIIHEDKTDLKRMLELKIKDCLITKLHQDVDILTYPEILKRVRFWGSIHPKSMHRILSKASNLEELSLTRYPLTQKNLLAHNQNLDLKKLIKLEILGYSCKDASEEVSNNVIRLVSQNMGSLSKVFLNVTCYWKHMDSIMIAFFDLLARHKNHISHVNATLVPAANGHELISLLPTNFPSSTKDSLYSNDNQLQLESLRLSLASKYIPCWAPIIQKQNKLVDLRIRWIASSEQPQSHITGISSTLLYPAIIQSGSTLVHLDLRELNLSVDDRRNPIPFDASILKCAQNLRRLVLVRNKDDCQRNMEPYGTPTIVNIDNCHPCLVDLEIVRFKCSTSELKVLIASSENLKSVKLQHTGSSIGHRGHMGVHGGLIELLTTKPMIKIINISPLNYHEAEKLDMLKSKYPGMSHGGDHLYFDFDRYRAGIPQPQSRYQSSTTCNSELAIAEHDSESSYSSDFRYSLTRRGFGLRSVFGRHSSPTPGCSRSQQGRKTITRKVIEERGGVNTSRRLQRSVSVDRLHEFKFLFKPRFTRSNSKSRSRSRSVNDL